MAQEDSTHDGGAEKPRKPGWYLILLSVLLIVAIGALAVIFRHEIAGFKSGTFGYVGAFIVSFMAGATIIVYVPGVPVVFALGGILPFPFLVGIAAGLGEAFGEFTGYMAGRGSESYLKTPNSGKLQARFQKMYSRIEGWMGKRGFLTVMLASSVFNPIFDLFGAAAGATKMPVWKFYVACALGKIIKGTYVAYFGMWGLDYILRWFGYKL